MRTLPAPAQLVLAAQHGVVTAVQLRTLGLSPSTLSTAVRQGLLIHPHRGVYLDAAAWSLASDSTRHAMRLQAVQLVADDAIGIAATSVVVRQLPVRRLPTRPVVARPPDRSRLTGVQVARRLLPPSSVEQVEGLRVVALPDAVVEVAASSPLPDALITVDAVLRAGVAVDDLMTRIASLRHRRRRERAGRAIELADPWSESWLESLSRGHMATNDLPLPLCNVSLVAEGRVVRLDFLWAEHGVVGEADGKGKYVSTGDVAAAHWREKRRHEWLQLLGFEVARWGAADVAGTSADMIRRIARARARQAAVGFTWPSGVRAELRRLPGMTVPSRITAEVERLRGFGIPITLVTTGFAAPRRPSIWSPAARQER